jgi:hypothetical protein
MTLKEIKAEYLNLKKARELDPFNVDLADKLSDLKKLYRQQMAKNARARAKDDAYRSCGLKKTPYGWE